MIRLFFSKKSDFLKKILWYFLFCQKSVSIWYWSRYMFHGCFAIVFEAIIWVKPFSYYMNRNKMNKYQIKVHEDLVNWIDVDKHLLKTLSHNLVQSLMHQEEQMPHLHANGLFFLSKLAGIFFPFKRWISFIFAGSSCASFVSVFSSRARHSSRTRRITAEIVFGRGSCK